MSQPSFSISQTAKACGVTAKNIRYYEQIGLIPKAQRHNDFARTGGNRLYREDDVRRLRFIRSSRLLGMGLSDIAELLALSEGKGCPGAQLRYRSRIESQLATVNERIEQFLGLRATLEDLLASADRGGLVGQCGYNQAGIRGPAVNRLFPLSVRPKELTHPAHPPHHPRNRRTA